MAGIEIIEATKLDNEALLVKRGKIAFNYRELSNYISKFNAVKDEANIKSKFEDSTWHYAGHPNNCNIVFDFEFKKEFNLALKAFATVQTVNKIAPETTQNELTQVKRAALVTNFFDYDYFEMVEDYIESYENIKTQDSIACILRKFLTFYQPEDYELFNTSLNAYKISAKERHTPRVLPDYRSVLLFDQRVHEYFEDHPEERAKYFPLLLWWFITRIIPLRPIEFVSLKRDCVFQGEDKEYYIIVPRLKENRFQEKALEKTREDTLGITKDIYDLVEEYRQLTSPDEHYLLSYKQQFAFYSKFNQELIKNHKQHPEVFWYDQLRDLIEKFYKEVIDGEYGHVVVKPERNRKMEGMEIQRIRLGDTRHFAFCSMMLQGLNPLTIMRIGGHSSVHTQKSYYDHLDTFVDDNVSALTNEIKRMLYSKSSRMQVHNHVFNNTHTIRRQMQLSKLKEQGAPYHMADDGIGLCFNPEYTEDCPPLTPCILCDYYFLEEDDEVVILAKTEALMNELSSELHKNILILKSILMQYNSKQDVKKNELLKDTSEQLERLIAQNSIVQAYRMKAQEVEIRG